MSMMSLKSALILLFAGAALLFSACSEDDASGSATGNGSGGPGKNCVDSYDCDPGEICDPVSGVCVSTDPPDGDLDFPDGAEDKEDSEGQLDGREIEVTPEMLDFGYVNYGEFKKVSLRVKNGDNAEQELKILNVRFLSTEDMEEIDFSYELKDPENDTLVTLPKTLQPGQFFNIDVTYEPTDEVPDTGEEILISSDDEDDSLISIELVPRYKGKPKLKVIPDPIEFGSAQVGSGTIIDIHLFNQPQDAEANNILKITSVTLSGNHLYDDAYTITPHFISEENPVYLAPNKNIDIELTFSPPNIVEYSNRLIVICNDPDLPLVETDITGTGIQADLEVIPNPVEFGPKPSGYTHYLPVQIRNIGNDSFAVDGLDLVFGDEFTVEDAEPALPWMLGPGDLGAFNMTFSPTMMVLSEDTLQIHGAGDDPDYYVDVRGSGTDSQGFESFPPNVILRANGNLQADVTPVRAGTEIVLDTELSEDPDGGNFISHEFSVEAFPPGADNTLAGIGPSRTSVPDKEGTWIYRAELRDDEGDYGEDSIEVPVLKPETLTILMHEANFCIAGVVSYELYFYNTENDVCGPDPICPPGLECCEWGPSHSGYCASLPGSNDGGASIVWDYSEFNGSYPPDLDGEYRIVVRRSTILSFGEHINVSLFKDGAEPEYWEGRHYFPLGGAFEWTVFLRRVNGEWETPYLCEPDGCWN